MGLGMPAAPMRLLAGAVRRRCVVIGSPGRSPGKSQGAGSAHAPPVAQDLQQLRGEHHVAILLALALLDADDHPLAVDGRRA